MSEIQALAQVNYLLVVLGFFAILFGAKEVIEIFSYFKKKFRLKTGSEEDKETIEQRIATLEKHDKWQYGEITKISKGIEDIKNQLLEEKIEKKRKTILDFCSSLSNSNPNKEAFDFIFKTYEKYEKILEENNLENGQVTASMEVIEEVYKEKMKHGF